MDLSVVLCTWNNSERLSLTLEALSRCVVPPGLTWELVVVNNNCTDETDRVVGGFAGRLPLVYVREPRQGLSAARNRGLTASRGALAIFTDDDITPSQRWLAAYWEAHQAKRQGYFFGGPVDSAYEGFEPEAALVRVAPYSVKGLDWGAVARTLRRNEALIGANWACPREAALAVGCFDEATGLNPASGRIRTADETDLMRRLIHAGLTAYYLPEARVAHRVSRDKCSLGHIAARVEATKYYWATVEARDLRGRVPRWQHLCAAELSAVNRWLTWVWARARRSHPYREYVEWRGAVGAARALRDSLRAPRAVPANTRPGT